MLTLQKDCTIINVVYSLCVSQSILSFVQLLNQNFTSSMPVGTDWGIYICTGLWNICKSLVCKLKMTYNVPSISQVIIFCRLVIIGQSSLIILLGLFVFVHDTTHEHFLLFNISHISISAGVKYYIYIVG